MTEAHASTPSPTSLSPLQKAALVMLHLGTAGWIGYGAFVKASEFNPLLLPPPIMAAIRWFVGVTSVDATMFLEWSLRAIIGAEVFIALAILGTRWARQIAIATLSFFCLILLIAMVQAGLKDGLKEALAGSCGCFGKAGLPASVMFLVDGILLVSAVALVPKGAVRGRMHVAIPAVLGAIAIFATPKPTVDAGGGNEPTPPVVVADNPSAISGPWPAAPSKYEANYFPKWAEWIGKPFRAQKLALAIERPMPDDIERGDWLVVFSRADCDHCQALYREHFAAKRAERVLKVSIPDTTGAPLGMPCEGCELRQVFRVRAGQPGTSPNYLVQTPVVLRLKDGVVTDVCPDVDKLDVLARVLGDKPAGAASTGTTASPAPVAPDPAVSTPAAAPAKSWPGLPAKLEPFYIAEFAGAVGKPIAENPFARLITGAIPQDFLKGRWIMLFYREDCEHCHELLGTYFTGKLPVRTVAVAIPDADPNNILDNPCDECVKLSMAKGPNYVIGTPVIVAINDGVIECVVENAEDIAAVEACLKFPAK